MRKFPKSLTNSPKFLGLDLIDLSVLALAIVLPQIFFMNNIFISLGCFLFIKLGRHILDIESILKGFEIKFREIGPYSEDQ